MKTEKKSDPNDRTKAALAMNFLLASMTPEQVKLFLSRDLRQWIDFISAGPCQKLKGPP